MTKIVISQPMFFPWAGIFEQIHASDIFVHYDDVQLPQGRSFTTRVQIKTMDGSKWLTAPVQRKSSLQLINDTYLDSSNNWQNKHLKFLENNYARAAYKDVMLGIVKDIYAKNFQLLSDLNIFALETIWNYLAIKTVRFIKSSDLNITGQSTERLVNIVKSLEGNLYITGHGAKKYMEHEMFEKNDISVDYINYRNKPYSQLYGDFTPYVSILDLIANEGPEARNFISSETINWKNFINEPH